MKKIIQPEIRSDLRKLGWYQLAGGLLGILFFIWKSYAYFSISIDTVLTSLILNLLFLYSVVCGVLCLKFYKSSLQFSLINQCFQLLSSFWLQFVYTSVSGLYIHIGINISDATRMSFRTGLSTFSVGYAPDNTDKQVQINLVALVIAAWIIILIKSLKEDAVADEVDSIGT